MSVQAILPYNGTSGWSGTDTSEERALAQDLNGLTGVRQQATLRELNLCRTYGLTWKELALALNLHHGQASGVLSVLHKAGLISRLTERRGRCAVYVALGYENGRETASQGSKRQHTCSNCGHTE